MDLHPDLMDLLTAFESSNVEYLVIGGWAVSFHSEPRFTKDLDLFIGEDDSNLVRVIKALGEFGVPESILEKARGMAPDEFLFFGVAPVRVDLLRRIPGASFAESYAHRVEADWRGTRVNIMARDDLIRAKRAAARPRDLADVRALEKAAPKR